MLDFFILPPEEFVSKEYFHDAGNHHQSYVERPIGVRCPCKTRMETQKSTTMEELLVAVARLNNESLPLFHSRDVESAGKTIQKAFDQFQRILALVTEDEDAQRNASNGRIQISFERVNPSLFYGSDDVSLNDDVFPMCPLVFKFPELSEVKVLEEAQLLALALLYNMATAYYCTGIQSKRKIMLERSLQFYELALSLFCKDRENRCPKDLVILAIQQNYAHLLCHFSRYEHLLSSIPRMLETLDQANVTAEQHQYFFAPIFHTKECGLPQTAASA